MRKISIAILLMSSILLLPCLASENDVSYVTIAGTNTVFIHVNDISRKAEAFSRLGNWAENWGFVYRGNLYLTIYKIDLEKLTRDPAEIDIAITVSNKEISDKLEEIRKELQTERDEEFARQLALKAVFMSENQINQLRLDYVIRKRDAAQRQLDFLKNADEKEYNEWRRNELEAIGLGQDINEGKISSGTYAKYIYKGPFESIDNVWQSFIKEVDKNNGYRIIDKPCFEIYNLSTQQGSLQELTTELYIPVEPK